MERPYEYLQKIYREIGDIHHLNKGGNILTTFIGQEAQGSETQPDHLIIERVELTHRRDMGDGAAKQYNIPFERALSRHKAGNATSQPRLINR